MRLLSKRDLKSRCAQSAHYQQQVREPYAREQGNPMFPWLIENLLAQLQLARDRHVPAVVGLVEVIQQASALADHLQQSTTGAVIFVVLLQVLSEMIDSLREQSNLNVGTAGVTVMHPKRFNCFVLLFHTVRFQNKRIRASYGVNSRV